MGFSSLISGSGMATSSLCLELILWEAHTQGCRVTGGKLFPDIWSPVTLLGPRPAHQRGNLMKLYQKAGAETCLAYIRL